MRDDHLFPQDDRASLPPASHVSSSSVRRGRSRTGSAGRPRWRHPPDEILATVRAIVDSGGRPAAQAATLAADLGWTELVDDLRAALGRHGAGAAVAEALWRLGVPAHDLTPALLATVEGSPWSAEAVQVLVTIGATTTAPQLARLAERDRSVAYHDSPHVMAWEDERIRADLRAAAATLASTPE